MANPFDQFDEGAGASATNPFDQFDASASAGPVAAQANPFDQFDGKVDENYSNEGRGKGRSSAAIPGAEAPMATPAQDTLGEKSLGILEGAATGITGGAAPFLGMFGAAQDAFRQGVKNLVTGNHETQVDWKKRSDEIREALTYQPRTETGQTIAEKVLTPVGEALQALGPVAPHFVVQNPIAGTKMLFKGKERAPVRVEPTSLSALDEHIAAEKAAPKPVAPDIPETRWNDMAADLGATPEGQAQAASAVAENQVRDAAAAPGRTEFSDMASTLEARPEQAAASLENQRQQATAERTAAAQEVLAKRQAELELAVKQKATLDFNAAERARQENAPVVSDAERATREAADFEVRKAQLAADEAQKAHDIAAKHEYDNREIGTEIGIPRTGMGPEPIIGGEALPPVARPLETGLPSSLDTGLQKVREGRAFDLTSEERIAVQNQGPAPAIEIPFNTRTRGQGGAVLNPFERQVQAARDEAPVRWFTSSPEAGRKTSYSLESQAARPNAEGQRYGPGQYIAQSRDFSSVYGGPEGRMYTVEKPFSNAFDTTKASNEKIYQSLVERTGSRTAANQMLQKAGYDAITFTSPRGDKLANIFNEKPLQDIGPAREKVRQQELTLQEYEPGKGPLGKQRGVIRIPGSSERAVEKLKGIEAFRSNLKSMAVDRTSPEEFLASQQGQPDIQQNIGQRLSNNFTKGSIYTADRLNNPGYTRVTARFREADSLAKGQQQAIVHDIYAPTMRALSDGEKANVWGALMKMANAGVRVSDEKLVSMGFNMKERDAIRIHQTIMDDMIPKIQAALDAAGMSHIKPEAAYLAAKLSGTFRKVMLDKENNVIGALGDRTKAGLARQEAEFMKLYPEAVAGKEQTMGPRANSSSMTDVINFLADKDPHMAEYLQASKEAGAKEAMNFRGAKTHTMEKKGVVGMAGNKPWESAVTNAREGFDAQVAYLNRMLEWAEKAKAEAETRPIIDGLKGTQPKAMQLASDYRDFALGKNPYSFAKVADAIGNWLSTTAGGKLSYANDIARGTKQAVNIKLLAANPGFLISNIAQPLRNMPELAAFLKARGMENGEAFGLGSMSKVAAQMGTGRYSPIMMKAMDYAAEHHVYASDLIDQRQGTNKAFSGETKMEKAGTAAGAIDHILQVPASKIEGTTRKAFFLTVVDMLHENGIREQDGLFDIASNLTDRGMNRYSMEEAPVWTKALGSIGKGPYNLMSFKFNELSRFASMVREFSPSDLRTVTPMATALAMQVATAGVMGTMGYVEANEIVKAISKALGSPTSITKILLDNADKHIVGPVTVKDLAYGPASTATGVDLSGRMGIGSIMGDVTSPADIALPGSTSLYTGAKSAWDFAKDPSKYNAMKAAVDILPGGNLLDRQFFSVNKGTDKEMGFNRNKVETGVLRNDADKMAKNFGMTGVNESGKKSLLYENKNIDQFYIDKRGEAVDRMGKDLFTDGKISPESIEKYKKAQGTMQNLNTTITDAIKRNTIPADKRDLLQAAAEAQLNPNKIKRRFH